MPNYSGREHNDRGDFKTRVDESLAKLKAHHPSSPRNQRREINSLDNVEKAFFITP